jgi:Zn-dependent protease
MNCKVCSQETLLPFYCSYCGGQFCSAHRLPENHACPNIKAARMYQQGQGFTSQSYNSYNYSYVFGQDPPKRKRHVTFSQKEVRHITIAALLVVGIGFSIGLYGNFFGGFLFSWTYDMMATFAAVMVASFLTHEIAHKTIAQQRGLWAEFRLTTWGAMLTFASIFLPFRLIAPGAMMIGGTLPKNDDTLKISLAGPITNIAYSSVFLGCAFVLIPGFYAYGMLMFFAAYINAFMALFNLVPFGVLDGQKIFSCSKKLWALAFVPSLVLTIFTFLYV